jgi:hypothetical protein
MKSVLFALLLSLSSVPAMAQVPPNRQVQRVMKCDKFLFITIKCYYVNKPIKKPSAKKPRVRVDITKPGSYNNMTPEERAIVNE